MCLHNTLCSKLDLKIDKQTNDQVNFLAAIKICRPSTTEADIKSTTRIINKAKKDIIIVTLKNNAVKNNIFINVKKLREGGITKTSI